ncbi:MAG: ABC transporter permease [Saprospiraceae bacterium]|nr:ABC transporter permease [Saprospiraceae bacterium]
MNQINIKAIFRNLTKGRFYTLINILGIAIGITSIVWAFQNYRFANSFDNFHQDRDQIFRIITKNEGSPLWNGYCPLPIAVFAKQDFPEVEKTVRLERAFLTIRPEAGETFNSSVHFTDPEFFDFFNFPLVSGSNNLQDNAGVWITESEAKKLFGNNAAVGKTIQFYVNESHQLPLVVKGVLKDLPSNSSIQFDILSNFSNFRKSNGQLLEIDDWSYYADAVFLKVDNPLMANKLANGFKKYLPLTFEARKDIKPIEFQLDPLSGIAKQNDMATNALFTRPSDAAIYGPLVLAILILLSACLNFANTTVARSNQRLKEMGVRKVLGGSKSQLIIQQLLESSLIVFFALCLSTIFTAWWLPTYNRMFDGIALSANYFEDFQLFQFMVFLLLFVTLLAGLYPSLYIARFNASQIFRGGVNYGGTNLFSRVLLGMQILIAFITVSASFGFAKNAEFQRDFNLGFNQNNIIGLWTSESDFSTIRDAVSAIPDVDKTAGSVGHLGYSWRNLGVEAGGIIKETNFIQTGDHYLDVMGVKLLTGRDFNHNNDSDVNKSMIISEKLCAEYGWTKDNAIGKQLRVDTILYSVIGVTKDLYVGGFFNNIDPLAMVKVPNTSSRLLIVQSNGNSLKTVYDQIKASWTNTFPLKPFNGFYQNEETSQAQRVNQSVTTIFFWFGIISVLFTLTGMFALISLTILKKNKEIAIRRVVGASLKDILLVINKSYFWVFIIAAGLGMYAGAALTQVLMDLIFKVNVGFNPDSLLKTFFGVCALILTVVMIKLWQVDRMKPSIVLKGN